VLEFPGGGSFKPGTLNFMSDDSAVHSSGASDGVYQTVTPAEVAARVARRDDVFVVDLREPRQFHQGHIPEAIPLPADEFADRFSRELDPDDEVIVVCERGLTSREAAKFLASQGFANVATMEGGMAAYDGPLERRG
jgi:rhodanese-related sulfurtransferase